MFKLLFSGICRPLAVIGAAGFLLLCLSMFWSSTAIAKGKPGSEPACDLVPVILYVNPGEGWKIVVANEDGSCQTTLLSTGTNTYPIWLPDGSGIVFALTWIDGPGIYYLSYDEISDARTNTLSPHFITKVGSTWNRGPSPSPTFIENGTTTTYELAYFDETSVSVIRVSIGSDGIPEPFSPVSLDVSGDNPLWLDENTLVVYGDDDVKVLELDPNGVPPRNTATPVIGSHRLFDGCGMFPKGADFGGIPYSPLYSSEGGSLAASRLAASYKGDIQIFDVITTSGKKTVDCEPENVTKNPEWGQDFPTWIPEDYHLGNTYIAYRQALLSKKCGERKPDPNLTVQIRPDGELDPCYKNMLFEFGRSSWPLWVHWRPVPD